MLHPILAIWHWFQEVLGINIGVPGHTPRWYNFDSGSGSNIGELALISVAIQLYRKHNCHVKGCPRIGHHKLTDDQTGTEYVLCKKHWRQIHPEIPKRVTLEHLIGVHKKNQENYYER